MGEGAAEGRERLHPPQRRTQCAFRDNFLPHEVAGPAADRVPGAEGP